MEFDSIPKPEILKYISNRSGEGADDLTITKEIRGKWPNVISSDDVAHSYISISKHKAPAKTMYEMPCPLCAGMPHLVRTCTTCAGDGYILVSTEEGSKEKDGR